MTNDSDIITDVNVLVTCSSWLYPLLSIFQVKQSYSSIPSYNEEACHNRRIFVLFYFPKYPCYPWIFLHFSTRKTSRSLRLVGLFYVNIDWLFCFSSFFFWLKDKNGNFPFKFNIPYDVFKDSFFCSSEHKSFRKLEVLSFSEKYKEEDINFNKWTLPLVYKVFRLKHWHSKNKARWIRQEHVRSHSLRKL